MTDIPARLTDLDKRLDEKQRPMVQAGNRNPIDVAEEAAGHIIEGNDPAWLFSMTPAVVVLGEHGQLLPLDDDGWLYQVAKRVTFTNGVDRDGNPRIIAPPGPAMKLIPSVVIPKLPPLDGIATTPYLDTAGNVVATDGYHAGSRRVLRAGALKMPAISEKPAADEVAQAVALLTGEWLADFPFAAAADKANAVAVLLTLTGRMFFRLVPLFVFDASTAGSGKGLLATTIYLIAAGEAPQVMELPRDGEEQRKKITSALLADQELIMWDESHVIQGRTLAAILTAENYSDRLLGGNKLITISNRFTQVALGNNVEVWGDMKRRVVPSRLVPDTAHPEHRDDFRHPDLEQWVRQHRGELLAAVLTIWRNWIAKGRPEADTGMGSFDRWARTVGGALEAAGVKGFRSNTTDWLSYSEDDDGWGAHLSQLRDRFGDEWFTIAEVAEAVETLVAPVKRPPIKRDPDKSLVQSLAYAYRGQRERWHSGVRLVRSQERDSAKGSYTWSVQARQPEPPDQSPGSTASPVDPDRSPGSPGSPVADNDGETAGQPLLTGDTGHTGDPNPAAEPFTWDDRGGSCARCGGYVAEGFKICLRCEEAGQ